MRGKPIAIRHALQLCSTVPQDCIVVREKSGAHAPHIRSGECVLVDLADRDPVTGGVFLLRWSRGTHSIAMLQRRRCQITPRPSPQQMTWWLHPFSAAKSLAELNDRLAGHEAVHLSEGPLTDGEGFRQMIAGRVIGLYQPRECR